MKIKERIGRTLIKLGLVFMAESLKVSEEEWNYIPPKTRGFRTEGFLDTVQDTYDESRICLSDFNNYEI